MDFLSNLNLSTLLGPSSDKPPALEPAIDRGGVTATQSLGGLATDSHKKPSASPEVVADAEAKRAGLDEKMKKMGDLSDEQKKLVSERTKGLSGDALVAEMKAIDDAMKGPNAERALATYSDLSKMVAGDDKARKRLTPEVMAMLVNGVGERRTESERGQAGVLGGRQARDAAQALMNMGEDDYKSTLEILSKAGQGKDGAMDPAASAGVEQSLILKAIAARRDKVKEETTGEMIKSWFGFDSDADKAHGDIKKFAAEIRGMKRADLINMTTLIDVDDANTSTTDPLNPHAGGDTKGDNDGLYQKFMTSCVPTTAQIVRGEADPIYALMAHKEGFDKLDSVMEKEQREVLAANGGDPLHRDKQELREKMADSARALEKNGTLDKADMQTIGDYAFKRDTSPEAAEKLKAVLKKVKDKGGDAAELEKVINAVNGDMGKEGKEGMQGTDGLNAIASDATHVKYDGDRVKSEDFDKHADKMEKLLRDGQAVPISIASYNPVGHEMLMTDVRKDAAGARSYLISDPWTGATRWVKEGDLKSGAMTQEGGAFEDLVDWKGIRKETGGDANKMANQKIINTSRLQEIQHD